MTLERASLKAAYCFRP